MKLFQQVILLIEAELDERKSFCTFFTGKIIYPLTPNL